MELESLAERVKTHHGGFISENQSLHFIADGVQRIASESEKQTPLLERIAVALETIAANTKPVSDTAVKFEIYAVEENTDMQKGKLALVVRAGETKAAGVTPISDSLPQAIAVFGIDLAGVYGASLAPGSSIGLTLGAAANGTPGTFAQDATPGVFSFTDANGVLHSNVQSLASGVFTPNTTTPDVNDPFNISYTITGGSGDSGSAQFETAVGVEVSEVIGIPTAAPVSPASAKH